MRYSVLSAVAAFASLVSAQTAGFDAMTSPYQGQIVPVGSSLSVNWLPGNYTGTVSLTLLQGVDPATLQLGPVLTTGLDNSVATFPFVPTAAGFQTYGIKISLDSDPTIFQYSFPFNITAATVSYSAPVTITLAPGPSYSAAPTTSTSICSNTTTTTAAAVTSAHNHTSSAYPTHTSWVSNSTAVNNYTATSAGYSVPTFLTTGLPSATAPLATPTGNGAVANAAAGGLAVIGLAFTFFL